MSAHEHSVGAVLAAINQATPDNVGGAWAATQAMPKHPDQADAPVRLR